MVFGDTSKSVDERGPRFSFYVPEDITIQANTLTMEKRSILASLLLLVVGLQTVRAQGFRVYKSDGTVAQFSLRTDSIVFYDGIGTDQDFGPFMPVNQCIVGTWYKSKNEVIIFNENGTTNYMEGATYEFFPYQGTVIISNASGAPISYFKVLKVTEEQMIVAMPGSEKLSIYSTKPVQFVTGITLSETSISLQPDESKRLTATVVPADADNPAVTWTSSNEAVAEVISNGLVVAVAAGTCTITCAATDGSGVKAECQVNVENLENNGEIAFSGGTRALTRADLYGGDAAAKLTNKFVVYGTKHAAAEAADASNDVVVFDNFQVGYTAGTAGTTASNSSDWEYVGNTAYTDGISSQGIKYWDYSAAAGYTFYAFSSTDISYPAGASDKVVVTKVTTDASSLYNKGYQVTVNKTVDLTFRNVGSKVRVGFYETIPGYSVKIDKFYIDDAAAAAVTTFPAMNDAKTDGFYASLQNVKSAKAGTDQTLNVTYYSATTATEVINRPKLTNPTAGYDYTLQVGDGTGFIGTTLGTSANNPTWAVAGGEYTPVFPFEGNTNPMLIKLDFTLTPDDGTTAEIKVRGARAIVPVQYVQWKSNFAYTYIFKISDLTNGTTGNVDANGDPTDPEGLKPITFDAIVVDVANEKQETITTVATNSITTYAEGAIVNEYTNGTDIYVVVSDDATHAVLTPSAIGTANGNAQVYSLDKAATEAEVLAQLTGSPMGITLTPVTATIGTTVPLTDGTTPSISNVKFTPSAAGTYAYVYTRTAYVAPTYEAQTSGTYDSSKTYYLKSSNNVYYTVTVPTEEAFNANKANLYLQTAAGTPGVYDVKVIKVE